ncbi:hypothetical protein [Bizionia myxarmorum]|uniref:Uncharacterized protein n=1 Tax=Bizionia myxarmorum TaxID=291186 RepID=A0A5D0RB17_9FLAO|nr:hypothetical protein [Bizionia myxarmorum]TYB78563.1 hypothetical protein ES674_01940 [Bizionia myxarmorum]
MKNILFILISSLLVNCGGNEAKNTSSLVDMKFHRYNEIDELSNYTKISDTVIYGNNEEPKHSILHLKNDLNNLVIFNSISSDTSNDKRLFTILDTLVIPNSNKSKLVTIGYCQINQDMNENLIAIVDKTDSLIIENIHKVWMANTASNKIESINNLDEITCFNEWFVMN